MWKAVQLHCYEQSHNRSPGDNCYISGYEGPNEIYEDVPERVRTLIFVGQVSNPEYETMTCGNPYNFSMLNSLEIGHLGKMLISPN